MLGTAVGVLHADHFVLEAFPSGTRADQMTRWARDLACLVTGIIFVWFGKDFAISGLRRSATASGISMIYVYSVFTACGGFIILFSLERLLYAALHGMPAMEKVLNTPNAVDDMMCNDMSIDNVATTSTSSTNNTLKQGGHA